MRTEVSIGSYGNYSSDNYGAHTQQVDVGSLRLYFSYRTVVAFQETGSIRVCENVWGTTTGKHLNWIDYNNKADRLSRDQFEKELAKVLKKHKLSFS